MGHLEKDQYGTSTLYKLNENDYNPMAFWKPGFLCGFQNCISDTWNVCYQL